MYYRIIFHLTLFFLMAVRPGIFAQGTVNGNEWIVPGQTYYKIPTAQTGIYAISYAQLEQAGLPLQSINHTKIQLFHRGVEQAISISLGPDNVFNNSTGDTLFFYGEKNDGTLDSLLYDPYGVQLNKYYNLYSDTTAYFLTWSSGLGKRMLITPNFLNSDPEAFHMEEQIQVFHEEYSRGFRRDVETYYTYGDVGEGWCSSIFGSSTTQAGTRTVDFDVPGINANGPAPVVEFMLVGSNQFNHNVELLVGDENNPAIQTFTLPRFAAQRTLKFSQELTAAAFGSGKLKVSFKVLESNQSSQDLISIVYVKIRYPQTITTVNAGEKYFITVPKANAYLEIPFAANFNSPVLYDVTDKNNVTILSSTRIGNTLIASVDGQGISRKVLFKSLINNLSAGKIISVDLSEYTLNKEYLILSHSKLMGNANEYAVYRSSFAGGSYSTLVTEINKLYNMFSYGERTPVAIRRFLSYYIDNSELATKPKFFFIIGKGLNVDYPNRPPYYRHSPEVHINAAAFPVEDFIPPFGTPGSDVPYSLGLGGKARFIPFLALGRIPVRSPQQAAYYFQKIQEHDALPDSLWRKNIVHLSGGKNENDGIRFRTHLNTLKTIAEGPFFGGKVKSFAKLNTESTVFINIAKEVNAGLSYVTFYGHSSANISDVDIGQVSTPIYGYNNHKKYPMLFVNGCSSANVYGRYSFVEDWLVTVCQPNPKGAIVVIGHTDVGYPDALEYYSRYMYNRLFTNKDSMKKTIGEIQQEVIQDFVVSNSTNTSRYRATIEQMTLQGDPATRIYAPEKNGEVLTDYSITENEVFIHSYDNKTVTAVSDSFALGIVVSNPGITHPDSFSVSVRRTVGSTVINYDTVYFAPINYRDTIYFTIRSKDAATFGFNNFEIVVDYYNDIPEVEDVENNQVVFNYRMPLSGVTTLFPKEYSIVRNQSVSLVAQSTDLLSQTKEYFIEIDTSYTYKSAARQEAVITSGSLIKWNVSLLPYNTANDSTVYYWRVRQKVIGAAEDTIWGESTFIYIQGSNEGWSQSEFPQFSKDNLVNVARNVTQKKWEFTTVETSIRASTVGVNSDPKPEVQTAINVGGATLFFGGFDGCPSSGVLIVAFDKVTGKAYLPSPGSFPICGRNNLQIITYFPANQLGNFKNYVNAIPPGDIILLVSVQNPDSSTALSRDNSDFKQQLIANFGAEQINNIGYGMPYIFLGRKGASKPLTEKIADKFTKITLDTVVNGINNQGKITSTLIGPASAWGKLYRTVTEDEADQYEMKLIRIGTTGNSDTLSIPDVDSLDLKDYITDADAFPFIKLETVFKDQAGVIPIPPQLKKWQVIYNGVPEGTLNPEAAGIGQYSVSTKQEGDSLKLIFVFEDIAGISFSQPLKVKYSLINQDGGSRMDSISGIGVLDGGGRITFKYTVSTTGFTGRNVLQVYVNPKLQAEEYYDNNVIEIPFIVNKDKTNPVLDVVFDGVHIMDEDIISPSPHITITLNDENKFLMKSDTSGMLLFIGRPGKDLQPVYFSDPEIVRWGQDGGSGNKFVIEYHPKDLPDGIYRFVVQGTDASGNRSGEQFYETKAEVINESTITHFYPYPNPFSSSTRFVFTLTGKEVPEDLKIQIMTVTGKVVREITKAELGPVKIGHNKSDYAWDGMDEFGDKLANGVYLYRVVLKNAGDNFKSSRVESEKKISSKAFKADFGKLYILR